MSARRRYHRKLVATTWQPANQVALPAPEEVHVWRFRLKAEPATLQQNFQLLANDEQARAGKFHYVEDRDNYILARGTLRRLLAAYQGLPPASLAFRYSQYGKPSLVPASDLCFNLSHAGGYALIAVTTKASIGVDLELVDDSIEIERLTARFFSPAEAREVMRFPTPARAAAFFRTWTRKEAFLKAHGDGLNLPLDQFSITVAPDHPLKIEALDWAPGTEGNWSLDSFMVQTHLPGAIVVAGPIQEVAFFDLPVIGSLLS